MKVANFSNQELEDLAQAIQARIWQLEGYVNLGERHNADNSLLNAEIKRLENLSEKVKNYFSRD